MSIFDSRFAIRGIVSDVGESFTMSGVYKTMSGAYGEPTVYYTAYYMSGVVQVMDGSEDEVEEGILEKEDVIFFVDGNESNASKIAVENYVTITTSTSGVFRVVNVIANPGHVEAHARRVLKDYPT